LTGAKKNDKRHEATESKWGRAKKKSGNTGKGEKLRDGIKPPAYKRGGEKW